MSLRLWMSGVGASVIMSAAAGHAAAATSLNEPASGQELSGRVPPVQSDAGRAEQGATDQCPFATPGLTVTLNRVIVEGATTVSADLVNATTAPYLGVTRGLEVVCEVRDRVALLFEQSGYRLTRVDVPPQRIENGELRLIATEGYLVAVDIDRLAPMGPSSDLARAYLTGIGAERPTPWANIERAVLLARDIPGADINIRLQADSDGPGALRLTASSQERKRFDLTTGAQHMGTEELGETALFARLDANSFTRFGDRTSLLLYSTTNGAQQVAELVESVALGHDGMRGELGLTYARIQPEGALAPLMIDGDFFSARLGSSYPFIRSQNLNVNGSVYLNYINQENSLGVFQGFPGGAPVLFDDRLRILQVTASADWRPERWRSLEGSTSLELRQGVGFAGGSELGDINLSRAQGNPEATVARFRLSARWTPGRRATSARSLSSNASGPWVSATLSTQWTNDPLLAYEEFQIGNYSVGRGYNPGVASGDKAWGVQIEAGWPAVFQVGGKAMALEPFAFYDHAEVQNLDTGGYRSEVSSYGLGVRAHLPWNFRMDVTWASPQDEPFVGSTRPDDRILVSLVRVFSFR